MSFRRRIILMAAGAVAAAIVIASVLVYVLTRNELRGQVDASLRDRLIPGKPQTVQVTSQALRPGNHRGVKTTARSLPEAGAGTSAPARDLLFEQRVSARASAPAGVKVLGSAGALPAPAELARRGLEGSARGTRASLQVVLPTPFGGATGYAQLVLKNGRVLRSAAPGAGAALPITKATRAVAAGRRDAFLSDATVLRAHVRVLTARDPLGNGVWQVATPLTQVDSTLHRLLLVLVAVSLGGIALAAALGLLVSKAALVPVRRLTGATERVAQTSDLAHRIPVREDGELGRLADSFNTMLAALERSQLAQRQLVSDASHELRTPLTSVRANLDALAMGERMGERDRARVISAARAQLAELTVLVGDLVDLSKTEVDAMEVEPVRLDLAAADALARARLHAPACRFELDAEPCLVSASPGRLDRAIANLIDNAVKWGPACGPVEIRVRDGCLEVRDRGPGIDPEDLPHVFDRFYRARAARGLPGSGLGLAIVRQVAETHGGNARCANLHDGGASLTLELPVLAMTAEDAGVTASPAREAAVPRQPAGSGPTGV